jgi:hypothetical protein
MANSKHNEGIWAKRFSSSMQGIKSAKLKIGNLALLISCMELDIILAQIPSFEVFRMCHY